MTLTSQPNNKIVLSGWGARVISSFDGVILSKSRFILQRAVKGLCVIFAVIVLDFSLIHLAPGDPALVMAGEAGASDAQYLEQLRRDFGLDRPVYEQLALYVKSVATLDLGYSYRQKAPVSRLLLDRLPATLLLTVTAFLISLAIGILVGAIAALKAGTWVDSLITFVGIMIYATPIFWVGLIAVLVFSVQLNWLPAFGMVTVGAPKSGFDQIVDVGRHLLMPAMTLGLFYSAVYARLTRASMIDVSKLEFVQAAKAKGLSSSRILFAHVLRNALLPIVTMAGIQAGHLVGGAVLVETVFAWPGIGRLAFDAVLQRDYNTLLGIFLLTSAMVVIFNLLVDLLYAVLDPRTEVDR